MFIDAYIETGAVKDKVFKDKDCVYVTVNDENLKTYEVELKPVYEYYYPVSDYFTNKEQYDQLTLEDIEKINSQTEDEDKKIYKCSNNMICHKRVCDGRADFNSEVHGLQEVFQIDPRTHTRTSVGEKCGTKVEEIKKQFELSNEIRRNKGLVELNMVSLIAESSHNIIAKTLNRYFRKNVHDEIPVPKLKTTFFDIEVDYDSSKAFPFADKAEYPINAITFYNEWEDKLVTYCLKPDKVFQGINPMSDKEAQAICDKISPDCHLCKDEPELLNRMLDEFAKCNVYSGWNSELFDCPYIINRVKKVLGEEPLKKWCHFGFTPMIQYKTGRDGKLHPKIITPGKVHIDYMNLYKKHKTKQQPSYKLNFIGELEVKEGKTDYEGTLEELYYKDFELFIVYNRQDAMLLNKIDKAVRFLEVCNLQAHNIGVTFQDTLGTTSWAFRAVINSCHERGYIMADKMRPFLPQTSSKKRTVPLEQMNWDELEAPGAWVQMCLIGKTGEGTSFDINSLYPSLARMLNLGLETVYGQIEQTYTEAYMRKRIVDNNFFKKKKDRIPDMAAAWEGEWGSQEFWMVQNKDTEHELVLKFEAGGELRGTGAQIYDWIYVKNKFKFALTANGTLIRMDRESDYCFTLRKWFAARKSLKKKLKIYEACEAGIAIDDELEKLLKE